MISIYNRTDYVMLPNIQAARALKRQIRQSYFSNWAVGKAEAFRLVADHSRRMGQDRDCAFWRSLMRENALHAIRDAKFQMEVAR